MEAGCRNLIPAQEQKARTFMAYTDRELLARLVQCEAGGEGENGMKAVASVVMNRVNAVGGEYARIGRGSLRNIVFQPGQFVCASETEAGAYNPQNIYNMNPTSEHLSLIHIYLRWQRSLCRERNRYIPRFPVHCTPFESCLD